MGVELVGEVIGIALALLIAPAFVLWLGQHATNQAIPHGVSVAICAAAPVLLGYDSERFFYLTAFSAALVVALLHWTYRRATKRPPSGLARLYAVLVGLTACLAVALAAAENSPEVVGVGAGLLWFIYSIRFVGLWVWRGFRPATDTHAPAGEAPPR
jgi:hypothetical protein